MFFLRNKNSKKRPFEETSSNIRSTGIVEEGTTHCESLTNTTGIAADSSVVFLPPAAAAAAAALVLKKAKVSPLPVADHDPSSPEEGQARHPQQHETSSSPPPSPTTITTPSSSFCCAADTATADSGGKNNQQQCSADEALVHTTLAGDKNKTKSETMAVVDEDEPHPQSSSYFLAHPSSLSQAMRKRPDDNKNDDDDDDDDPSPWMFVVPSSSTSSAEKTRMIRCPTSSPPCSPASERHSPPASVRGKTTTTDSTPPLPPSTNPAYYPNPFAAFPAAAVEETRTTTARTNSSSTDYRPTITNAAFAGMAGTSNDREYAEIEEEEGLLLILKKKNLLDASEHPPPPPHEEEVPTSTTGGRTSHEEEEEEGSQHNSSNSNAEGGSELVTTHHQHDHHHQQHWCNLVGRGDHQDDSTSRPACSVCAFLFPGTSTNDLAAATVFCHDCDCCLCEACDDQRHEEEEEERVVHRVEYILPTTTADVRTGRGLFSELYDLALMAAAIQWILRPLWLWTVTFATTDSSRNVDRYFMEPTCPVTHYCRRGIFRFDPALYSSPFVRNPLDQACGTEDSIWKLFTDLWVRGVWTHTDSLPLVLTKGLPAATVALLILWAMLPLLAIPYATVVSLVKWVDVVIVPTIHTKNTNNLLSILLLRWTTQILRLLNGVLYTPFRVAQWACRSTILGLLVLSDEDSSYSSPSSSSSIRIFTGARKRPGPPSQGLRDVQLAGLLSRVTRVFGYSYRHAKTTLWKMGVSTIAWTLALRVALLHLPRCLNMMVQGVHPRIWRLFLLLFVGGVEDHDYYYNDNNNSEPPPSCLSMDVLARRLIMQRTVVGAADEDIGAGNNNIYDGGGWEQQQQQDHHYYLWSKLQQENDSGDEALKRLSAAVRRGFSSLPWPWVIRAALVGCFVVLLLFGGLVQQWTTWAWNRHQQQRRRRDDCHSRLWLQDERGRQRHRQRAIVADKHNDK